MGAVLQILAALAPVVGQVLLLLIKHFFGSKTALDRARDIQEEVRHEATLMKGGKEDEMSRREKTRMVVLDQLLRQRKLRRNRKPSGE